MQTLSAPRLKPVVISAPQRSPEWYIARLGNVTGSEAKKTILEFSDAARSSAIRAILQVKTLTPKIKTSPEFIELWDTDPMELFVLAGLDFPESADRAKYRQTIVGERLTGQRTDPEKFMTYDMKWGVMNERLALAKYQLLTGNYVEEAPFMLHPDLRAGASPDGLIVDRQTGLLGVVECKCLRTDNHLYNILKLKEVPEEYMIQIHMEMWITGRDFCDFIGFDPRLADGLDIFIKRVHRDDGYINHVLEPAIKRFLEECDRDEKYFRALRWAELKRRKVEDVILDRVPIEVE